MLTSLTEPQRQAVLAIASNIAPLHIDTFGPLLETMSHQEVGEKTSLFTMGQPNNAEYFVLDGIVRSYVLSPDGQEVTLNFFVGPSILTPAIARNVAGVSQVTGEVVQSGQVVQMQSDDLVKSMVTHAAIQHWGDAVMRAELVGRMQREIALASQPAKQRLEQFRSEFPGLEDCVPHHMIASFLGVTPVTLSRLRND